MEERYRALLTKVYALLMPLGWRKAGGSFRLLQPDGLGKILQFQRDRYNTRESCRFTVNAGIYLEPNVPLVDRHFPECACQFRTRPACISSRYGRDTWWTLDASTDLSALTAEVLDFLRRDALPLLDRFPSRAETVEMLLDGRAQACTDLHVMHFGTARLLTDLGYGERVLPLIASWESAPFRALAAEIREKGER